MKVRKSRFEAFLCSAVAAVMLSAAAVAEERIAPGTAEAVTEGNLERYSLVAVDEDILRVDRQNGTVDVCREQNQFWRCNPVPLAEEAYIAEINELAAEVDRLAARLEELESGNSEDGRLPPGSALDRTPKADRSDRQSSELDEVDEELEKVLTFTESAMRRLFGMVRELQQDFDREGN